MTTTAIVSARALWWHEPEVCQCDEAALDWCTCDIFGGWASPIAKATIDGTMYITDRFVLLPAARLADWEAIDEPIDEVKPQARDGLAEWLTRTVLPGPSDRVFSRFIVDPLEGAGFRLRALEGVTTAHGICDPDLQLVGLATPLRREVVGEAGTGARAAAL